MGMVRREFLIRYDTTAALIDARHGKGLGSQDVKGDTPRAPRYMHNGYEIEWRTQWCRR